MTSLGDKPPPRWLWVAYAVLGPGPWLVISGALLLQQGYVEDFFLCSVNPHRAVVTSNLALIGIWLGVILVFSLLPLAMRMNFIRPVGLSVAAGVSVALGYLIILAPFASRDYDSSWDEACRNTGHTYNSLGFAIDPGKGR